jgi:hypothetical protein
MRVMTVLFIVEAVALAILWLVARRDDQRIRRRAVRCPLDGCTAHLLVAEQRGVAPAPSQVVRCSLLERDPLRGCNRQCATQLPVTG